jgi:RNA-splicing ligase RtcB
MVVILPSNHFVSRSALIGVSKGNARLTWCSGSAGSASARTLALFHINPAQHSRADGEERDDREEGVVAGAEGGYCAREDQRAEEAGFADKDLDAVDALHRLDISRKVVSLKPVDSIEG